MTVFENLKNFIRHGKQAAVQSPDAVVVDQKLEVHHKPNKEAYDQAVKQIIKEENEQRQRLPRYQGLKEDRFQLIEKIGDGAFSVVYRALDKKDGAQVAVKIIRKQDLSNSQRSSILKEVSIMRQLNHKNIVQLIDFSESSDYYFIVLELIPGGELFHQIVRLTYFSEDLSRHVILQVADAIRYLHEEAGVVHRDIKPENLLFYPCKFIPSKEKKIRKGEDESKEDEGEFTPGVGAGGIGTIKLADFGLSKIIWDSKTMTPCGTVGYTAPEIVKDERYSKSVDMWALGCVLYTILCGFPPFYDESIEVLTEKVARGKYTFLSPWWDEISDGAKDLVSHLLTVDPEKRYTIDEFLAHPWITLGQTEAPRPEQLPQQQPQQQPQQPSGRSGAAVVAQRRVRDPQVPAVIATGGPAPASTTKTFVPRAAKVGSDGQTQYEIIDGRDGPASPGGAGGFMSPAAVTLKEVFDVSNAVHRMEEENARLAGASSMKRRGIIVDHIEEEEEDKGMHNIQQSLERANLQSDRIHNHNNAPRDSPLFELHLEGATLLGRRKRQHDPTLVL